MARHKELMRKHLVIASFIKILLKNKNKKNLSFLFYCSALVVIEMINKPGPEGEEIKEYVEGIIYYNSQFKMNRMLKKISARKNKTLSEHLKKVIWVQVVMALIEYPFEKFLIPRT